MPIQNYTTYTDVDTNSRFTITAPKIIFTGVGNNESAYVYYDFGASFFAGNFTHQFDGQSSSGNNGSNVGLWGLSDVLGDSIYCKNNGNELLAFVTWGASFPQIFLIEFYGGLYSQASYNITGSTNYYFTVSRDMSVGTYGTAYLKIYSDSGRTNLLQTVTLTLHSHISYRYLYGVQSNNSSSAGNSITGYVENLNINPMTNQGNMFLLF